MKFSEYVNFITLIIRVNKANTLHMCNCQSHMETQHDKNIVTHDYTIVITQFA